MNAEAIHDRAKLRETIDRLLLATPVEGVCPVFDERAQRSVIGSECPSVVDVVRPSGSPQAIVKIIECRLRDVNNELIHAHHSRLPGSVTLEANRVPGACGRALVDLLFGWFSARELEIPGFDG